MEAELLKLSLAFRGLSDEDGEEIEEGDVDLDDKDDDDADEDDAGNGGKADDDEDGGDLME